MGDTPSDDSAGRPYLIDYYIYLQYNWSSHWHHLHDDHWYCGVQEDLVRDNQYSYALDHYTWSNPCVNPPPQFGHPGGIRYPQFHLPPNFSDSEMFNACPRVGNPRPPRPPPDCKAPTDPDCPELDALKLADLPFDPGTMESSPPTNQLVNLQSCFWIRDARWQNQAELELKSLPYPDGRKVVFYFWFSLGLNGVDWSYGDGTKKSISGPAGLGTDKVAGANCAGDTSNEPNHTYQAPSDTLQPPSKDFPDGGYYYTVRVDEHFGLTATGQRCVVESDGKSFACSAEKAVDISRLCKPPLVSDELRQGCTYPKSVNRQVFVGQFEGVLTQG